jgi:hypothetical protein
MFSDYLKPCESVEKVLDKKVFKMVNLKIAT